MRRAVPSWSIHCSDNPSAVPLSPTSIAWDHGSPYTWQPQDSIELRAQRLPLDNEPRTLLKALYGLLKAIEIEFNLALAEDDLGNEILRR